MPRDRGEGRLGRLTIAVGLLSLAGFINFRIAMPSLVAAPGGSVFLVGGRVLLRGRGEGSREDTRGYSEGP